MTTQLSNMTPTEMIRQRVDALEQVWAPRKRMVKKWYDLIELKNDLAQENMESVIGNDPRSSYNLATWLLTPKTWSITSLKLGLSDEQITDVSGYEQQIEREIMLSIRGTRGNLHGSYLSQAVKLFIATGWICLAAAPTKPRWTINAWHPMTVFPSYNPDGTLGELARKFILTDLQARAMIFTEGWLLPTQRFIGSVTVRQWWVETPFGVHMATTMNSHLARPLGPTMFQRMPIYCQPAGGLPDDGTISDDAWKAEVGQSIVASVMELQKNYDRMLTYMQQILKDTANPKWVERLDGGQSVLKTEDLYKRGAKFTIGIGEDIWALASPGAPVDLRPHEFDLRNQIQRATFQDNSFGGGDASAFMMANITGSTKQLLQPFLDGIKDANGELVTRTAHLAQHQGITIGDLPIAPGVPDDVSLDFDYDIQIPGDFIQRANAARILNPEFRMSQETIMGLQFPEVKNRFEERLRLTTEDVMQSEMTVAIKAIQEYRRAALQASIAGDGEAEQLFVAAAAKLEAQIVGQAAPGEEPETFSQAIRRSI